MRRSIVSYSSLVVLLASIFVLALSSPAGATKAAMIICPQQSGQTCCPTPPQNADKSAAAQPICCPSSCCVFTVSGTCCGATLCVSGLTIASAPNPSTEGHKVVISGAMLPNPVAGTPVVLWQEVAGQSSFTRLAQTTLDSAGQYRFTMLGGVVKADRTWYVTAQGLQSSMLEQQVAALVVLSPAAASVAPAKPMALRGNVTPSHAGELVLIQQKMGGRWRVIGRPRLSRSSTFDASHSFTSAGTVELRAVLRADARNERSDSRAVAVTVR